MFTFTEIVVIMLMCFAFCGRICAELRGKDMDADYTATFAGGIANFCIATAGIASLFCVLLTDPQQWYTIKVFILGAPLGVIVYETGVLLLYCQRNLELQKKYNRTSDKLQDAHHDIDCKQQHIEELREQCVMLERKLDRHMCCQSNLELQEKYNRTLDTLQLDSHKKKGVEDGC